MFGSLKKLFSRPAAVVPPLPKSVPAPAQPRPSAPAPLRPAPTSAPPAASPAPVQTPAPQLSASAPPSPSTASSSLSSGTVSDEKLVLALKSVVARIPAELMPLVKSTSGNLEFPLQRIMDQL